MLVDIDTDETYDPFVEDESDTDYVDGQFGIGFDPSLVDDDELEL